MQDIWLGLLHISLKIFKCAVDSKQINDKNIIRNLGIQTDTEGVIKHVKAFLPYYAYISNAKTLLSFWWSRKGQKTF